MILVRLRLGLFERDLADRFSVSVSTVSRICYIWITFLYVRLKELPLWPSRDLVQSYIPKPFRELYPSTRVIIDATEIYACQNNRHNWWHCHFCFKAVLRVNIRQRVD